MRRRFELIAAIVMLLPAMLSAQWLDYRTPGIPRTAGGKPNIKAPAPKTSDGRPDSSGMWRPEMNPYRFDLIQDLKDESVFKPTAEALFLKRVDDFRRDDPVTNCLPVGRSLYLNALPMIPQTETKFESTGAVAEFVMDANGKVTRLVFGQTEGATFYDRKP